MNLACSMMDGHNGWPALLLLWFALWSTLLVRPVKTDEDIVSYHWTVETYPNMQRQEKLCTGSKRNPPSSICDPEETISKEQANKLDNLISNSSSLKSTACLCSPCTTTSAKGVLIKVALMYYIKSDVNATKRDSFEHFTEQTRINWDFAAHCKHDVLVAVSVNDKMVHISMGEKAAQVIGYDRVRSIIRETEEYFMSQQVYVGLESIIASIQSENEKYSPLLSTFGMKKGTASYVLGIGLVLLVIAFVLACVCINRESKNDDPEARKEKILAKLKQQQSLLDHHNHPNGSLKHSSSNGSGRSSIRSLNSVYKDRP